MKFVCTLPNSYLTKFYLLIRPMPLFVSRRKTGDLSHSHSLFRKFFFFLLLTCDQASLAKRETRTARNERVLIEIRKMERLWDVVCLVEPSEVRRLLLLSSANPTGQQSKSSKYKYLGFCTIVMAIALFKQLAVSRARRIFLS